MAASIWKFAIPRNQRSEIQVPIGAKVLSVQMQGDVICFWAKVDTDGMSVPVEFFIFGTGWKLPENIAELKHFGTVQDEGFVWHVYAPASANL